MKRKTLFLIVTLLFIVSFCGMNSIVSAHSITTPDISPYICEENNYHIKNTDFEIFGNYHNLSKNQIENSIDELGNKILIIYFTNTNIRNSYQLNYYENNFTLIYYKDGIIHQDDYTTLYKEFTILKKEYKNFYNEKMNNVIQ